jgi:hypothetical protein
MRYFITQEMSSTFQPDHRKDPLQAIVPVYAHIDLFASLSIQLLRLVNIRQVLKENQTGK